MSYSNLPTHPSALPPCPPTANPYTRRGSTNPQLANTTNHIPTTTTICVPTTTTNHFNNDTDFALTQPIANYFNDDTGFAYGQLSQHSTSIQIEELNTNPQPTIQANPPPTPTLYQHSNSPPTRHNVHQANPQPTPTFYQHPNPPPTLHPTTAPQQTVHLLHSPLEHPHNHTHRARHNIKCFKQTTRKRGWSHSGNKRHMS
jgi:hypothetical protein